MPSSSIPTRALDPRGDPAQPMEQVRHHVER
jgi:hypothetical protein